jgi:hypothetical protein
MAARPEQILIQQRREFPPGVQFPPAAISDGAPEYAAVPTPYTFPPLGGAPGSTPSNFQARKQNGRGFPRPINPLVAGEDLNLRPSGYEASPVARKTQENP